MKHIFKISFLLLFLVFGCDQVNDDTPTQNLSLESVRYAKPNDPIIISIYGDFNNSDVTVVTSSESAKQVDTQFKVEGGVFLKYLPENVGSELIDLQVLQNDRILGT